jgi:N-acetylglucosaminyldiphosphoundecaprenol N-acetyl-beta-D-mannosaminyltransferase
MNRYASLLAPAIAVGVGAAFDFHAGAKRRAPVWMQRSGLEWAHRLGSEPRRLAGRYLRTNSEFLVRAALEIASSRRGMR